VSDSERAFDRAFSEAVLASLGFLQADFGLTLKKNSQGSFLFESPGIRVAIDLDRQRINVSLEPIAPGVRRAPPNERQRLALDWILRYFGQPVDASLGAVRSPDEVANEVKRLGELLRRFCDQFLRGDFKQWPQVYEYAEREANKPGHQD
jgi:hypothetical protein